MKESKITGQRKFILAIITMTMFTLLISLITFTQKFTVTSYEILAIGAGYSGIIGIIVYGYKQEYKYNFRGKNEQ